MYGEEEDKVDSLEPVRFDGPLRVFTEVDPMMYEWNLTFHLSKLRFSFFSYLPEPTFKSSVLTSWESCLRCNSYKNYRVSYF